MKRMDQINVIPFIDIMLVLLAIVLTTATFISEGRLKIQLPDATSQSRPDAPKAIEIGVDAGGNLFFATAPIQVADLGARLDALDKDSPIVLRIDAAVRFEYFVAVLDQLETRQFTRLTILTHKQ
jgi:biopolymer transport protein ExbD